MTRLDLHEVILDTLGLLRSDCQHRGIVVSSTLAPHARFAVGDRVQLQQVILNLGMNGVEAMSMALDQPPVLSVSCQAAQPGYIRITVADTGIGLDPDTSTRIFDAFFTTKPDGIGMGLAICRSIVEAHGGRLWVSPNTPRGSAFQFTVRQFDNGSN